MAAGRPAVGFLGQGGSVQMPWHVDDLLWDPVGCMGQASRMIDYLEIRVPRGSLQIVI